MEKYAKAGREVRQMMLALTPLVEPLSIDEAFLDLSGTARLHGMSPAKALARFAAEVESKLEITVSIGLSCNKFLAKVASDLDKPRGFAVLGASEAPAFLAPKPVSFIFGVGKVSAARYARDGFHRIADLQRASEIELMRRYGEEGRRLSRLARGLDERKVSAERETKSVSSETTFERDIADFRALEKILWSLAEEVSARLKAKELAGATVTLKLKTADFKIRTRARSLESPTQLARRIFAAARGLLERETDGTRFRLLGVGRERDRGADEADPADLVDGRAALAEHAVDSVRARFGDDARGPGPCVRRAGKSRKHDAARYGHGFWSLNSSEVSLPSRRSRCSRATKRAKCRSRKARSRSRKPAFARRNYPPCLLSK